MYAGYTFPRFTRDMRIIQVRFDSDQMVAADPYS